MENESVVQQPAAPVAAPLGDLSLADYRAQREAAAKDDAQPPAPAQEPAADAGADDALAADATSGTTQEQQEAKKKKQGGFQKTISRQSEEIAELKRQLASGTPAAAKPAEAAAAAPAAKAAPEPVYDKPKPKLEDCEGIEEFAEKLADWKHDERAWKQERKAEAAKHADAAKTLADNWKAKEAEFKAGNGDYDAVLAGVSDVMLSKAHQQVFLESEHGVALAYELAQDPEALKKIAAMTPLQAAREIGMLEAKYAAEPAAPNKEIKVSAAPRPIRPVSGGSAAAGTADPAKLSLADYRKAREAGRIH